MTAGWQPDPFGRFGFRWWDGEAWGGYVTDARGVAWDPAGADATTIDAPPALPGLVTAAVGWVVAVALGFGIVVALRAAGEPGGRAATLGLSELGLWAGLVGACVVVSRRRGSGSIVSDFGYRFRWIDLGFGLAGSIAARVLTIAFAAPIPFPGRPLKDTQRGIFGSPHGAGTWLLLIVITCVGAPLVEELFFRGLLQTRLVSRYGPVIGVGAASLMFGASHMIAWEGWASVYNAWAIVGSGLALGLLRYQSGRLGPAIAAHAMFNGQVMVLLALLNR